MSLLLALMLAVPANKEATLYRFDVTIYQGNPDGSKEKGNLQVISSPQIITRDGQEALISVGQQVPVVTDIKQEAGLITNTVSNEQVGYILRITPKTQSDKTVVISTKANFKQVFPGKRYHVDTVVEQTISACRIQKPGDTIKVPFYNTGNCQVGVTIPILGYTFTYMQYTGKEMWMEIKITEVKETAPKP